MKTLIRIHRACTGFDGDYAVGEAIRRMMRQISKLKYKR